MISDSVQITALTVMGSLLTITIPAILAYLGRKQVVLEKKQDDNHAELAASIEVVRKDVNGKMQKLIDVTGAAEKAKGKLEGAEEEKAKAEEKKDGN